MNQCLPHGAYPMAPVFMLSIAGPSASDLPGMVLDGPTKKIAYKVFPTTTSPMISCLFRLSLTGTSATYRAGVFADTATTDQPNMAAQLGGWTSGFTVATGWTGTLGFSSNTGALTMNSPVWVVIEYVSGTTPDASNKITAQDMTNSGVGWFSANSVRCYNGSDWTTISVQWGMPLVAVYHDDGSGQGYALDSVSQLSASALSIFNDGTSRKQGFRFMVGAGYKPLGVMFNLFKTGSPTDLTWTLYQADTSKASVTLTAAKIADQRPNIAIFPTPPTDFLAASTYCYLIASTTGGSGGACYDLRVGRFNVALFDSSTLDADFRFVHGTASSPSGLTVVTTEVPWAFPIIAAPSGGGFSGAASSGGAILGGGLLNGGLQ